MPPPKILNLIVEVGAPPPKTNGPANDEVEKFITEILLKVDVPAVMPPAKVKAPAEVNLLTLEKIGYRRCRNLPAKSKYWCWWRLIVD